MPSNRPASTLVVVLACACVAGCAATPGHARSPGARGRPVQGAERGADASGGSRCASPYAQVCGPATSGAEARSRRHKSIVLDVERATLAFLAEQLSLPSATRDAWDGYLAAQPGERRESARRLYRKARALEVAHRVAPLEGAVREELERLRALTLARLRAARRPDRAAIRRVERAALGWVGLAATHAGETSRAVRIGCGDHLLIDDAWVTKDAGTLTLCPGFLLVSLDPDDPTPDGPAFRERIAFLLAHELGHVAIGPTTGAPTREAEIRADALAAEIIAAELESRDAAARAPYLRRTLEAICTPEGDRTHPPGPVRIDDVVARHPVVAAALSCSPSERSRLPSG